MAIILLQMGKVASTAIAQGLRGAGCEVLQAHIGAPERLTQKFWQLMSAQTSAAVADRLYASYLQELKVTFRLTRQRLAQAPGQPLKVITLTRDPLDWYWSHLVENHVYYRELLARFQAARGGDPELPPQAVLMEVLELMFRVLAETEVALDAVAELPRLVEEARAVDPSGVVAAQLYSFLLPLRWFDEDFLPATGIDVYATRFDRAEGLGRAQGAGISALLLRFEDRRHLDAIAAFAGVPALELAPVNRSGDKTLPFALSELAERGRKALPGALAERIYASRYADFFGYPVPQPTEPAARFAARLRRGPALARLRRLWGGLNPIADARAAAAHPPRIGSAPAAAPLVAQFARTSRGRNRSTRWRGRTAGVTARCWRAPLPGSGNEGIRRCRTGQARAAVAAAGRG